LLRIPEKITIEAYESMNLTYFYVKFRFKAPPLQTLFFFQQSFNKMLNHTESITRVQREEEAMRF
jgi:hypothetical protein